MKKLFGFTLAEVLITMGIIGVVAALTTPALSTNIRRSGYATTLRATVTDLENAFMTAITDQQADDLFGTRMWNSVPLNFNSAQDQKENFYSDLNRYLKMNGADYELSDQTYYTNYPVANRRTRIHRISSTGDIGAAMDMAGNCIPLYLKNGAVVFIRLFGAVANVRQGDDGEELHDGGMTNAADVFIDVNGITAPNTVGRDIFTYYMTGNGELLPAGGRALVEAGEWNRPWQDNCIQGSFGNNDWGGWSCTGRLAENNYVFDY